MLKQIRLSGPLLLAIVLSALFIGTAAKAGNFAKGEDAFFDDDFKTALAVLTPLAESGNADAQSYVGRIYLYGGEGVAVDPKKAETWLSRAGEQGHEDAIVNLINGHKTGELSSDPKAVLRWLTKGAEVGMESYMEELAVAHIRGQYGPVNHKKALFWFEKLAAKADEEAIWFVANAYRSGKIVERNYQTAARWLQFAIGKLDDSYARADLGMMYLMGQLGAPNNQKAVELLRIAALDDVPSGQARYGLVMFTGVGVQMDKIRGYMWWEMARTSVHGGMLGDVGRQEARGFLQGMGASLSAQDREKALKLASGCKQNWSKGAENRRKFCAPESADN